MLDVIVVGAGIAGLAAAISLRRVGHRVRIYERSAMNNEIGAAINVPPNAIRFLVRWGLDPVREGFVKAGPVHFMDPKTLEITATASHADNAKKFGGAYLWYAHRVDLHDALKKLATGTEGPGIPVKIFLESWVVGYTSETPSIHLSDGEEILADVVIGADGIHSIACERVLGHPNPPIPPSHYNSCYRFLISAATLQEDPMTRWWNEDANGRIRLFTHNDTNRRLVSYPCRNNTIHNFVGIYKDDELQYGSREDYQAGVEKECVLERFSDFHPRLLAVISKATEVKRWPLLYRAPISKWRRGKLVLAGDAAHPMLPHQGQGGAMGLEDGIVLGMVLCDARTSDDVEEALDRYESIRRNRASAIQILSGVGQDQSYLVREELVRYVDEKNIPTSPAENFAFNFGYDVVEATLKVMKGINETFELPPGFFQGSPSPTTQNGAGSNGHIS